METHSDDESRHDTTGLDRNGSRPPDAASARAALAGLDSDGAQLAERVVTPWWYHPILGMFVAVIVGAQALPSPWSVAVLAFTILGILLLMRTYRRRYGVLTTEPAGPRSKRLLIWTIVVFLLSMVAGLVIKLSGSPTWWVLVPAAGALVATIVVGRRYDQALRAELSAARSGPGWPA